MTENLIFKAATNMLNHLLVNQRFYNHTVRMFYTLRAPALNHLPKTIVIITLIFHNNSRTSLTNALQLNSNFKTN